ncbi:CHAT domain-containing protein [Streptomyces sp. NPDC056921]|uniref:CHAT domain-containing protein n=1 Tax=Streptomyces sp. NPDC056921 TaxID=3345966 RepID=UPI00363D10DE
MQSGQTRLALGHYHEALVATAKAGDREAEVELLNNVAQCYLMLGQPMLFITYILWALDSALELHDRHNQALALMSLATVWDPHEARGMFTEAWRIYAELKDSRGQAMALTGVAGALEKLDKTSDALHFLGKAAGIGANTGDTGLTAMAHLSMGQLCAKAEQPMAAWDHYERSWAAFEALRRLTFAEPVQFELIEEAQDCVTGAISLALAQQENSGSEEDGRLWRSRLSAVLERSRARVLTDRLRSTDVASQTLPPAALEKLAGLADQVRRQQSRLHANRSAGTTEPGRLNQADEELRRAKDEFDEYEAYAAQSFPRYRSFSSVEPGDESSLDTALGRQAAVVEYAAIDDQLVSVVRESGELTVHRHGELAEITALDRELSELCSHSSDTSRIAELSRRLHHRLLEPLERTGGLREAAELVIVPTPEVFGFPIEALRGADGYAFEKYAISYMPSTSVTRFLGSPPSSYEPALVMANPDGTLHRPEEEVAAICRNIKRLAGGGPFIGPAATKAEFKRWAPEVRLIHLASHAHFRADTPAFSSIVLAGHDPDGTANLEVRDLPPVQIRSCLTVLSGCETGRGSVTGADEMIGFIRAFLASGSCAVLATRWRVRDRSTSIFMRAFYEGLIQEKLHPLDAIGRARAELMGIRPFQHPAFWAPFTYFGLPASWNHADVDGVRQ